MATLNLMHNQRPSVVCPPYRLSRWCGGRRAGRWPRRRRSRAVLRRGGAPRGRGGPQTDSGSPRSEAGAERSRLGKISELLWLELPLFCLAGSVLFFSSRDWCSRYQMTSYANLADYHRHLLWQVEPPECLLDDGKVPGMD